MACAPGDIECIETAWTKEILRNCDKHDGTWALHYLMLLSLELRDDRKVMRAANLQNTYIKMVRMSPLVMCMLLPMYTTLSRAAVCSECKNSNKRKHRHTHTLRCHGKWLYLLTYVRRETIAEKTLAKIDDKCYIECQGKPAMCLDSPLFPRSVNGNVLRKPREGGRQEWMSMEWKIENLTAYYPHLLFDCQWTSCSHYYFGIFGGVSKRIKRLKRKTCSFSRYQIPIVILIRNPHTVILIFSWSDS